MVNSAFKPRGPGYKPRLNRVLNICVTFFHVTCIYSFYLIRTILQLSASIITFLFSEPFISKLIQRVSHCRGTNFDIVTINIRLMAMLNLVTFCQQNWFKNSKAWNGRALNTKLKEERFDRPNDKPDMERRRLPQQTATMNLHPTDKQPRS